MEYEHEPFPGSVAPDCPVCIFGIPLHVPYVCTQLWWKGPPMRTKRNVFDFAQPNHSQHSVSPKETQIWMTEQLLVFVSVYSVDCSTPILKSILRELSKDFIRPGALNSLVASCSNVDRGNWRKVQNWARAILTTCSDSNTTTILVPIWILNMEQLFMPSDIISYQQYASKFRQAGH